MSVLLHILLLFTLIDSSTSNEFHDGHFKLPRRRFFSLWNCPTEACKTKHNVTIDLEKYGIVANEDQKWHGNYMNIFYINYGLWPLFVNFDAGSALNRGIPQLANLTAHLDKMAEDVEKVLPDKDYEGMAVVDFESWSPIYEQLWEEMEIYRIKSEELVKEEHLTWNKTQIYIEAKRQFESAAKEFMLKTLQLCRKLRPKALWGYYGFPRCYNHKTNTSICRDDIMEQNNQLKWMFNESSVILPSIYIKEEFSTDAFDYVKGNILEAMRVGNLTGNGSLPVFAYVRLKYVKSDVFLNESDMYATVTQSAELGASGIIIWAASAETTESYCKAMKLYIENFFGQFNQRLSSIVEECSEEHCNSNGRCQLKMSHLKHFQMSDFLDASKQWRFIKCNCDRGWEGEDCSAQS